MSGAAWSRRRWLAAALGTGTVLGGRWLAWPEAADGPALGALLPLSGETPPKSAAVHWPARSDSIS